MEPQVKQHETSFEAVQPFVVDQDPVGALGSLWVPKTYATRRYS
jgi:hypothetical protein